MPEDAVMLVASEKPYYKLNLDRNGSKEVAVRDIGGQSDLEWHVEQHHVIWALQEDGVSLGDMVFDGENYLSSVEEVEDPASAINVATTDYVNAIAETMVSEVELLASSVADAMPDNQDLQLAVKRFNNKTRIARAAIASKNPETMAVLRDYLSDNEANNAVTIYMYDDGSGVMR